MRQDYINIFKKYNLKLNFFVAPLGYELIKIKELKIKFF